MASPPPTTWGARTTQGGTVAAAGRVGHHFCLPRPPPSPPFSSPFRHGRGAPAPPPAPSVGRAHPANVRDWHGTRGGGGGVGVEGMVPLRMARQRQPSCPPLLPRQRVRGPPSCGARTVGSGRTWCGWVWCGRGATDGGGRLPWCGILVQGLSRRGRMGDDRRRWTGMGRATPPGSQRARALYHFLAWQRAGRKGGTWGRRALWERARQQHPRAAFEVYGKAVGVVVHCARRAAAERGSFFLLLSSWSLCNGLVQAAVGGS